MGSRFKKLIFFTFIFLFFNNYVIFAKRNLIDHNFKPHHEFGFNFGGIYYIGDLNPNTHFYKTNIAFGGLIRYFINSIFSIKSQFTYGNLEAYDSDSEIQFNKNRNLSFISEIFDFTTTFEINFFKFKTEESDRRASPYLSFGFTFLHFNPKSKNLKGDLVELAPLVTEGQGLPNINKEPYSLYTFGIPIEVGYRIRINHDVQFSLFYKVNFLLTDYLDDVSTTYAGNDVFNQNNRSNSIELADKRLTNDKGNPNDQRGDSNLNDIYLNFGASLTFNFFNRNKRRCFKFEK